MRGKLYHGRRLDFQEDYVLSEVINYELKLINTYGKLSKKLKSSFKQLKSDLEQYECVHDTLRNVMETLDRCEDMDSLGDIEDELVELTKTFWD